MTIAHTEICGSKDVILADIIKINLGNICLVLKLNCIY